MNENCNKATRWGAVLSLVFTLMGAGAAQAESELKSLVVFTPPIPIFDSNWVAEEKGYYKDEGLDVKFRLFSSGTTALQTFRTGEGDINFGGDLPAINYWLSNDQDIRVVSVLERDSKGYLVTALKSIQSPQDLKGKTIATRVGSTGSFFISEFLRKNGLSESDVTIKNLDTQIMPTALCGEEIAAFFIFQPFGERAIEICPDKVHHLSTAEGYIQGYAIATARPKWLEDPANRDTLARFLRATEKGARLAESDPDLVIDIMKKKFNLGETAVRSQWEINQRVIGIDKVFYEDFCKLFNWMKAEGKLDQAISFSDLVSGEALKLFDPAAFTEPPADCPAQS